MVSHIVPVLGGNLQVDFLTEAIIRIRKYRGDTPPEQPLIRYGFFKDEWPDVEVQHEPSADTVLMSTGLLKVRIQPQSGSLTITDVEGKELLSEAEPGRSDDTGFEARFTLPADRQFFGLGDQTRDRLQHRGTLNSLWVENVTGYIPIPFVLTSDGFGLLVNTTRRLLVDLGHSSAEWFGFSAEGGTLDYYFIHGPALTDIIRRYTSLTGKPPVPPKWALGLWFICRTQANDREMLEDCYHFRNDGIPCDAIGLEPGWMDTIYDYSIKKDWSKDRFPIPGYDRTPGRYTFLRAARRMGFKPGLWLCNDYDLSWEEERRAAALEVRQEEGEKRGFEQDEHLSHGVRMDRLTEPQTPWYEHLEDFVSQGAEWFKQDGANQVLDHPDRLYGNGMRDDEMHNLNPLLYSKQMYQGFAEHTNRRPMCFTPAGWAGLQHWTGTWTGDTGGEEKPLAACLNLTMSGHGMVTCDMEVTTKEGIHFGFMLPWAQLNSWNYFRHPWFQGAELQAVFTGYARLRYALLPYLYAAAWEAYETGLPMMRAMPLDFPDDPETYNLLKQYMFGRSVLVGAFGSRVYLPEGKWYDYWSGDEYEGPGWVDLVIPPDRGGPLMVKAGAIIPQGPDMDYVGQLDEDDYLVQVFPGAEGEFTLYEDDGMTLEYEQGAVRKTRLSQRRTDEGLQVEIAAAEGSFTGALPDREWSLAIWGMREKPSGVQANGNCLDEIDQWEYDEDSKSVLVYLGRVPANVPTVVVVAGV